MLHLVASSHRYDERRIDGPVVVTGEIELVEPAIDVSQVDNTGPMTRSFSWNDPYYRKIVRA
jgi:hypothetical protein